MTQIDQTALRQALEFHDQGFTPWSEEKELFIAAARAYLSALPIPSDAVAHAGRVEVLVDRVRELEAVYERLREALQRIDGLVWDLPAVRRIARQALATSSVIEEMRVAAGSEL